jgi:hypothetical protein
MLSGYIVVQGHDESTGRKEYVRMNEEDEKKYVKVHKMMNL